MPEYQLFVVSKDLSSVQIIAECSGMIDLSSLRDLSKVGAMVGKTTGATLSGEKTGGGVKGDFDPIVPHMDFTSAFT